MQKMMSYLLLASLILSPAFGEDENLIRSQKPDYFTLPNYTHCKDDTTLSNSPTASRNIVAACG